jgi:hypothetical protein
VFQLLRIVRQLNLQLSLSITTNVVISNPANDEVHSIQYYVSDLRQVGGFLRVLRFPTPIKPGRHDIAEILLKVALNTITTPIADRSLRLMRSSVENQSPSL